MGRENDTQGQSRVKESEGRNGKTIYIVLSAMIFVMWLRRSPESERSEQGGGERERKGW